MCCLIELILTVIAWFRGWQWYVLIPWAVFLGLLLLMLAGAAIGIALVNPNVNEEVFTGLGLGLGLATDFLLIVTLLVMCVMKNPWQPKD